MIDEPTYTGMRYKSAIPIKDELDIIRERVGDAAFLAMWNDCVPNYKNSINLKPTRNVAFEKLWVYGSK